MNRIYTTVFILVISIIPTVSISDQVQINITAKVMAKTCTVASESRNFLVNLDSGDLRGAQVGVPFSYSPFTVKLEDCSLNINTAHLSFSDESDAILPDLLNNSGATGLEADGIALALFNQDKKRIDIRDNTTSFAINHAGSETALSFFAAYVKTKDTASAGKITSFANFDISYD